MPSESARAGSLQRLERYSDEGELSPWLQSSKVKLFAVSFSIVLVLGLVWTVLQPLVYRSSATVLMTAPAAIDAGETGKESTGKGSGAYAQAQTSSGKTQAEERDCRG